MQTSSSPYGCDAPLRHVLARELGEGARRRHLHLLVDLRGAHVERAAENERKAEDVVDLIRVVAAPGGDDGVGARGDGHRRSGISGSGLASAKMIGRVAMLCTISARDDAADREADEHVGADERLGRACAPSVSAAKRSLYGSISSRAPVVDDARAVAHDDVLALHAEAHVELGSAIAAAPAPEKTTLIFVDLLADDLAAR